MISIIVAIAKNGVIGAGGTMPWHLSEDFRHFKAVTTGHAVIMGRKTFESIGRPLPNRRNIVITRNSSLNIEGCETVASLGEALEICADDTERFVIGGGEIFRQAMPLADKLYITHIEAAIDGDTVFPAIDNSWRESAREDFASGKDFPYPFSFVEYLKK